MHIYLRRVISASLSPNTEADDVWRALRVAFSPWKWFQNTDLHKVQQWFRNYFNCSHVALFNSGRSALLAILQAFEIGKGDEVIVQAFTCVAVPNSVLWSGATPVYADIDASYNLNSVDVEKKITRKTKAIIVQHTFGIPADMSGLQILAKKHHLLLIEDCAHALGGKYRGKKLGTFGDAAFFSFGRDKAVSSVWGGAAVIHASHEPAFAHLRRYHASLRFPRGSWTLQQLFHPVAFSVIIPLYGLGFGRALLVLLQKLHALSVPVYREEKLGKRPADFPAKYPNALAVLLMGQLNKLDRYVKQRQKISDLYARKLSYPDGALPPEVAGASFLRYPVMVDEPERMLKDAKKRGILLGNWYHNIIDPTGTDFRAVGYTPGSCPQAEEAAKKIINLPTLIPSRDAGRIVSLLGVK